MRQFKFISYEYCEASSNAIFRYSFEKGPILEELLTFHGAPKTFSDEQRAALNTCLRHLHLAAGVSYYKLYAPREISIQTQALSENEAKFFNEFYIKGLAEFSYKNDIDIRKRIDFPWDQNLSARASSLALPRRSAVLVGGGKDSIVTIEALKRAGENIVLFAVGNHGPIRDVIEKAKIPYISVSRKLSSDLKVMNKQDDTLNGHVPITGIVSFIATAASIIYGFDTIVLSNESSANEGNLTIDGFDINHQYSKSIDFEIAFQHHISQSILKNIQYFSFLRPLTELAITRLFSHLKKYHSVFVSCNRAFTIHAKDRHNGWCGNCPKCRFVFLSLALFMKREDLVNIFGVNLLADQEQESGYRELIGLEGCKPFECVGQIAESQAAFLKLSSLSDWQNTNLVQTLAPALNRYLGSVQLEIDQFMGMNDCHTLPSQFRKYLDDFTGVNWEENSDLGFR